MKYVVLISFALLFTMVGYSQKPTKKEQIKTLLEMTGAGKLGVQVAQTMIASFKKNGAEVSDEFWDGFSKKLNPDEMIDMIIPIYDTCFSEQDIQALIAFYKSPIGKKLVDKMPYIAQKSVEVGQVWGQKIGAELIDELKQKGYIKD
jgi:hypothetical protein